MATLTRPVADERRQGNHVDRGKVPEKIATPESLPFNSRSPTAWLPQNGLSIRTSQEQEYREVRPKHKAIQNVEAGEAETCVGNSQLVTLPSLDAAEDGLQEVKNATLHNGSYPQAEPNIRPETPHTVDMIWKLSKLKYVPRSINVVRVGIEGFPTREAQDKYQRFMDYRREMCEKEQSIKSLFSNKVIRRVLLPSLEDGAEPAPYILIKGCDKTQVNRLHTELSKRVWRREYYPPLKICYELGSLLFLASQNEVFFAKDQQRDTLCGAAVSIMDSKGSRTVTLGGILESNRRLWALTAGHSLPTAIELEDESLFSDPNAIEYDDDVEAALVIPHSFKGGHKELQQLGKDQFGPSMMPNRPEPHAMGHVQTSGPDWSLVSLHDPLLALPNLVDNVELGISRLYLHEVARKPGKLAVVLAGASGQKKMKMIPGEAELCLPSGEWIVAWELEVKADSPLSKGDSGSLVVDADTGVVYGHIIAMDLDTAYIHPLVDVLANIESHNRRIGRPNPTVSLPAPFDVLASLCQAYSQQKRTREAARYARESLSRAVLDASGSSKTAVKIHKYLERSPDKKGIIPSLEQLITVFGASVSSGLSSWDEWDIELLLTENFDNGEQTRKISAEIKAHIGIAFPNGAEIGAEDDNDQTTLWWAAGNGFNVFVQLLLAKGTDVDAKDLWGHTSLSWAARNGHKTTVELLLEKGADAETTDDNGRTPLSWASQHGHKDTVLLLVEKGTSADVKDTWGRTPLLWAAKNGHKDIVKLLVEKGAEVDTKDIYYGWTPLLCAAVYGHKDLFKLLVEKGADIKAKDDSGRTMLFWAAENGHKDIVDLLVKKSINFEARDKYFGRASLSWGTRSGYEDLIQLLVAKGVDVEAKDDNRQTPLSWAAENGHKDIINLLVEKGANLEARDTNSGRTPLLWAAENELKDIIELLVNKGANIEAKDKYSGRTSLSWAARSGHKDIVELLVEKGADVEAKDNSGQTPLSWAARNGYKDIIELLIKKDADIETRDTYSDQTPLSWAAENGHKDIVELLIENGADVNAIDNYGQMPLSWAAENEHKDIAQLLVRKGADVKAKDKYSGRTPLSWAARSGYGDLVQLLIEKGADLEAKDNSGRTPLLWAAENGHRGVVELLVNKGAEIEAQDNSGQTPLLWASVHGHKDIIGFLVNKGANIEAKDSYGRTSLLLTAKSGYKDIIGLLVKEGAEVEAKDKYYGRASLSWAARSGHTDIVELLVEKGADIETKDISGRTPLLWAAQNGYKDIVELLIEKGADFETKDTYSDQTPLCWAADNGHKDIVELLVKKGADSEARDRIFKIWTAHIGDLQQSREGYKIMVSSVTFSPDGKLVASTSGDHAAKIWTADTVDR